MELIPRGIESQARDVVAHFPVTVIQGARQVGKSTLAQTLSASPDRRFTLDDDAVRAALAADPRAFLEREGPGPLVLDEIQRAPELLLAVKAEVDRHRAPGRFVLTGSANLLKVRGLPDSLAGRAVTIPLHSLGQGELHGRRDDLVHTLARGLPRGEDLTSPFDRSDYARSIVTGGYPEVQGLPARMRGAWIDSYLDRLIHRDARELRNVQGRRLEACLALIAANPAGELVKARLAHEAAIPATSITAYLDLLEDLFLIDQVRPWTPNLTHREVGRPKLMLSDTALAARLARTSAEQLADPLHGKVLGGHLEAFVALELLRQRTWSEEEFELLHYRDAGSGLEVDLVVELSDGRVLGIEVKASSTHRSDHIAGLVRLREKVGDRWAGGIVLTTAPRGFSYTADIVALPITALWEL